MYSHFFSHPYGDRFYRPQHYECDDHHRSDFLAGRGPIVMKHIFPNAMGPILVVATLGIGGAILTESSLSFLGLGVQPPTPSWGNMLQEGKDHLTDAWWLVTFPGLAIFI